MIYALDPTDPSDMLSATCFQAVVAHGTAHEIVMHKIYKNILIPKMVRIREQAKAMRASKRFEVPSVSVAGSKGGASAAALSSQSLGSPSRSLRVLADSTVEVATAATPHSNSHYSESDDDEAPPEYGPWYGHEDEWDIVLCLDGDSAPLAAILESEKMKKHGLVSLVTIISRKKLAWGNIKFLKWAAGCSPTQSPNDAHGEPINFERKRQTSNSSC
jgi:hypothetical protein